MMSPSSRATVLVLLSLLAAVALSDLAVSDCDKEPINKTPFCDTSLSFEKRAASIVSMLTLEEKALQLGNDAPAIPRLNMSAYNWWTESLHGLMTDCSPETGRCPTSYQTPINSGATFNTELIHKMATQISDEARVFFMAKIKTFVGLVGLDMFAPNINIFRDPRWGRGQETPGEDPFLTGEYAKAYITGLQEGNDRHFLKLIATAKHFAGYSLEKWHGAERFGFDAKISDQDLRQTYFPAFEKAIKSGHAHSLMCSYNAVNGVPSCANNYLLQKVLREEWGFDGYVVSDCDAVANVFDPHHFSNNMTEAVLLSLQAGTDVDCGDSYPKNVVAGVQSGFIPEALVDRALMRLYTARLRLGMFDSFAKQPVDHLSPELVHSEEHQAHALRGARESIVLLKNEASEASGAAPLLPLAKGLGSIAVIGPNANVTDVMCGNYFRALNPIPTPLEAIAARFPHAAVSYALGCDRDSNDTSRIAQAVNVAQGSDVAIVVLGLDQKIEAEGLDRESIALPGMQLELLQAVVQVQPNTVLVLINGGAIDVSWAKDKVPAIVEAFYPGEKGGLAIADVLTGAYNPSGRLPYTIHPASLVDKVPLTDMTMRTAPGRTYRFYTGEPVYPFGFGLSYTTFKYELVGHDNASLVTLESGDASANFDVKVTNTGERDGDVSVLAFVSAGHPDLCPLKQLASFRKVSLKAGASKVVSFSLKPSDALCIDKDGQPLTMSGTYAVEINDLRTQFRVVA